MNINERHIRAAELIARGVSYEKVGEDNDVRAASRTVAGWMLDPDMRALVEAARRAAFERAAAVIGGNLEASARTILGIVSGAIKADVRTRFAAATWVLERSGLFDGPPAPVENHLHIELPPGTTYNDIAKLRDDIVAGSSGGGAERTPPAIGPAPA